jgi:hypothetical protein
MDFLSDKGGSNQHVSFNCNGRSSSFGTVPITAGKHPQLAAVRARKELEAQNKEKANFSILDTIEKRMATNPYYKKWKQMQSKKEREMEQNPENEHLSMKHQEDNERRIRSSGE